MRSFRVGALVTASRGGPGLHPATMSLAAERVASLGADALFVRSATLLAVEPVTLLSTVASSCDLVLGAVVSLAGGRNPAVVAKLATTLALLAPGRCALIFEAEGDGEGLVEAVVVAKALMGDGPVRAGGVRYEVRDAFNEPRSNSEDLPAIGALVDHATESLLDVADLVLVRSADSLSPMLVPGQVIQVVDEQVQASRLAVPVVVEISGGELDHVADVVARISARAR